MISFDHNKKQFQIDLSKCIDPYKRASTVFIEYNDLI